MTNRWKQKPTSVPTSRRLLQPAFTRVHQGSYSKHETKFKKIQEHFGGMILHFFKNIIAHKNIFQVYNRFNNIFLNILNISIEQIFIIKFFFITMTGFKDIQERSVQIQEHSRVLE